MLRVVGKISKPDINDWLARARDWKINYPACLPKYYNEKKTVNVLWNDPTLAIDWQLKDPIISRKDKNNPTIYELFPNK